MNRKDYLQAVFALSVAVGLAIVCGGKGGDGDTVKNAEPAFTISAGELFNAYAANEVAADQKYKEKIVQINGTVDSIGKDIMDSIYVTFRAGGQFSIMNVQCFFSNEHASKAAALVKGQQIKVKGRVDGKLGNVMVKDCSFVE